MAVIRMENQEGIEEVARALGRGGVYALEVTMTVPNALQAISRLRDLEDTNFIIGVGSVLNKNMVLEAINAGAQFVVSPIFKEEIIETSHSNNIPVMPGAFTPSEIYKAYECGADVVKVFPADVLGMSYFKSIKAPMPFLKIMPTGGVTLDNAGEWLAAGACAVGVGSALVDSKAIKEKNYDTLTEKAKRLIQSIDKYKNN